MDDFLYKLRNARKKTGYDRNRRGQDSYTPRGDRNKGKMKKPPQTVSVGFDHLAAIRRTLETISENQKQLMDGERLRREIEERKAQALEKIAGFIGQLKEKRKSPEVAPEIAEEEQEAPQTAGDKQEAPAGSARADRDRVLKIIQGLREEGQTYEHIARHLETRKIPTLSGRGKWRGQTIYRLYKETV
jgi:hypothetical protein